MIPHFKLPHERAARVLIVEDDDLYFESLHRHFKKRFDQIVHAGSLDAAVKALKLNSYDLVAIDLGLPSNANTDEQAKTRIHVLESLLGASPNSTHVVITGQYNSKEAQECRKAGARGYFSKARLNSPKLAELLGELNSSEFVEHSGNEYQADANIASYPVLTLAEEECLQWVEKRPKSMKRIELFKLMARHFSYKNYAIAEQKYKRARSKVIAYERNMKKGIDI